MPQFMFKSPRGTGYIFGRAVPEDIRPIIGKREFKVALGGDHRTASQRCRELAVETAQQIVAARSRTAAGTVAGVKSEATTRQSSALLAEINEVNQDWLIRLRAAVFQQVRSVDREHRYHSHNAADPAEKLREIERLRAWANLAWHGDNTAVYGWLEMMTGTLQRAGYLPV